MTDTAQGYKPQLPPEYTDPQPVETVDGLRVERDIRPHITALLNEFEDSLTREGDGPWRIAEDIAVDVSNAINDVVAERDGLRARIAELERRFAAVNVSGFDNDTQAIEAYIDALESDLADVMEERDGLKVARTEREAIINGWPWYGDLDGKTLMQAVTDEMSDMKMLIEHCTEAYGWMSQWKVSKPQTLPSVVIAMAEDRVTETVNEETAELNDRIDALESDLADVMEERDRYRGALLHIEAVFPYDADSVPGIVAAALDAAAPGGRE